MSYGTLSLSNPELPTAELPTSEKGTSMSAPAVRRPASRGAYLREWRHVPGRAVYLLSVFVVAIVGLVVLAVLFWLGVGLIVLVVGLPLVVLALLTARGLAAADIGMLRMTGLDPIPTPDWPRSEGGGFWRTLTTPLRDGHYWVALVHGVFVKPVVSTISFALAVVWLAVSLGGLTYWFWGVFLPRGDTGDWGGYVSDAIPWMFGGWSSRTVEVVLYLLAGVLFATTLPWVLGGLARAHHGISAEMLGRWRSDDLAAEARAEAAAREAAVGAEADSLWRLERDIHDGPQQRLVRVQMDLSALERRAAAGDADAAAELAREVRVHAQAALDELRALSSGVAPPLLADRGLSAALSALAATASPVVRTQLDADLDSAVPGDVARTVYFVVAELLTNVAKHAHATEVDVVAAVGADGPTPSLMVRVRDDGRGGAVAADGHGLAGLQGRVAGLRGSMTVISPHGGPTDIVVHIPLAHATR